MRWTPGNRRNIDDARGRSAISMGRGLPALGIGGVLVVALLSWATGTDFLSMLSSPDSSSYSGPGGEPGVPGGGAAPVATTPEEEREADFVDAVMEDAQETWEQLMPAQYQRTRVVLFRDGIDSACGAAQSATGPFYCPADRRVYLDLGFFSELTERFGAPGEFARAYVIAHEVGHHVQRLTGVESHVRALQERNPGAANELSVRLELQADCFAGVWGHAAAQEGRAARGDVELEPGDIEAGLNAAAAIGDDRLQRMSGKRVAPDRFTHGSSAQRVEWFKRGLASGRPGDCDTLSDTTR
jgi:predicted metalloprotease